MSGKHYKKALIEAAASGASLPLPVRDHVDACAHCRIALNQQQALFAAIDAGMHRIANSTLPPGFFAPVHANLSEQPARSGNLASTLAFVCATMALALGIGVHGLSHYSRKPAPATVVATVSAAVSQSPADQGASLRNPILFSRNSRRPRLLKARSKPNASEARNREPEVLVPSGEEELLLRFYETNRAVPDTSRTVFAEQDLPPKPLSISRIEVTEIKIEKLEPRDGVSK